MTKKTDSVIIEPLFINRDDQYWAMYACAFFEFYYEHKNQSTNFQKNVESNNLPPTMANLKANSTNDFIAQLRSYFKNWGFQYLLSHYLRSENGECWVDHILDFLSDIHKIDLRKSLTNYGWYVTGKDSRSGSSFITNSHYPLLGDIKTSVSSYARSKDTDLCLLLNYEEGVLEYDKLAILGEVEGGYKSDILKTKYWDDKPKYSQFGIGVIQFEQQNKIDVVSSQNGNKCILILKTEENAVKDFIDFLDVMDWVFYRRFNQDHSIPNAYKLFGLTNTINFLIEKWNIPIYEVIRELRLYIKVSTKSFSETNEITMPSIPNLIL